MEVPLDCEKVQWIFERGGVFLADLRGRKGEGHKKEEGQGRGAFQGSDRHGQLTWLHCLEGLGVPSAGKTTKRAYLPSPEDAPDTGRGAQMPDQERLQGPMRLRGKTLRLDNPGRIARRRRWYWRVISFYKSIGLQKSQHLLCCTHSTLEGSVRTGQHLDWAVLADKPKLIVDWPPQLDDIIYGCPSDVVVRVRTQWMLVRIPAGHQKTVDLNFRLRVVSLQARKEIVEDLFILELCQFLTCTSWNKPAKNVLSVLNDWPYPVAAFTGVGSKQDVLFGDVPKGLFEADLYLVEDANA